MTKMSPFGAAFGRIGVMKAKSYSKVKKATWDLFSKYIRLRDHKAQGEPYLMEVRAANCVTCHKMYPIEGKGSMQAGHFIPGRKNAYLFDEKQVNSQCYNCNIRFKGNWPAYYEVMVSRHGTEVEKMIQDRTAEKIYTIPDLLELQEELKQKINDLS